jgi:hypothetical protein
MVGVSLSYPETGVWEARRPLFKQANKSLSAVAESRLEIALHSPKALVETGLPCVLQRKARTVTAFVAKRSVLSSPVCLEIITKYGYFSRISEVEDPTFSAGQTTWRRGRDSNPQVLARTTV